MNSEAKEIRIKVNGGFLVATRNCDTNNDGITVTFETEDNDIIDIVDVKCEDVTTREKIKVRCYEDVYDEDFTKEYTIDTNEAIKALNE